MKSVLPLFIAALFALAPAATPAQAEDAPGSHAVTLTYLGHSCIQLTAADGTIVVTDPYGFSRPSGLEMIPKGIPLAAATVSHSHPDHSGGLIGQAGILQAIKGADVVIMDVGGDEAHPLKEMVAQLVGLGVHTIIPGHFSIDPGSRFYGSPTVDEFIRIAVPKDMKLEKSGSEIELRPGMPDRILIMTPSALSRQ